MVKKWIIRIVKSLLSIRLGCLCSDIHGCNVFGDWIDPAVCVNQVENLEPYIERKLFSVNTGHATVAYAGAYYDYQQIDEAIQDERVLELLKGVLHETSELLLEKWGFEMNVLFDPFVN